MEMRNWTMPQAAVEQFQMSEYIAACGDENRVYKFTCDAGEDSIFGYNVYFNGADGIAGTSDDQYYMSYTPCGKTHEASTQDSYYAGNMRKSYGFGESSEVIPVMIWKGENDDNVHCTPNVHMDTWETAKS